MKKDVMKDMRDQYDRAVDADQDNRTLARSDIKFVTVQGNQWDETQRKARKGRPCYEFPILRSHWRQVCNDQKQARPSIKISGVEDGDKEAADLRQGMIRNIERMSNASKAYDIAFEEMTAGGFGAWRIVTKYVDDDSFEQDIAIEPIHDAINRVWVDPDAICDDGEDAMFAFVEETISRDEFKRRWPKADCTSFESSAAFDGWFTQDEVRIVEYWRKEPVDKVIYLLSDGKVVSQEEFDKIGDDLQGATVVNQRKFKGYKVVSSICSGAEELEGPTESAFYRIPIVTIYGNRGMVDGVWQYAGMVRWSRDPQKLLNYNLTTAQEIISKQPKSPHMLTVKMLEGDGVKAMWDKANAIDAPYLVYTPDPMAPGGPNKLPPPDMPAALTAMAQLSVDMLKASDGIFDASVGARSNETSGKAIIARQREGDTATFDYQDSLNNGIRATGLVIVKALPKIYDTQRSVRILGRDGGEKYVQLYQPVRDEETGEMVVQNDLSAGKYDVSVTSGSSYSTQRAEFVDMIMSISQSNPAVLQVAGDLVMSAMDFPKSDEVAERLKFLLPPQIQQTLGNDKKSPELMQMQAQFDEMQQEAQMAMQGIQQQLQECAAENEKLKIQLANKQAEIAVKAQDGQVNAQLQAEELEIKRRELELKEREQALKEQQAAFEAQIALAEAENRSAEVGSSGKIAEYQAQTERAAKLGIEAIPGVIEAAATAKIAESFTVLAAQMQTPKTKVGRMVRLPDGSYQMEQVETFDEVVEPTEPKSIVESATELVAQMQAPKMKKGKMTKLADGSYQMEQREV